MGKNAIMGKNARYVLHNSATIFFLIIRISPHKNVNFCTLLILLKRRFGKKLIQEYARSSRF